MERIFLMTPLRCGFALAPYSIPSLADAFQMFVPRHRKEQPDRHNAFVISRARRRAREFFPAVQDLYVVINSAARSAMP